MKTVGLIVEYNPFHNGHKYHLEESKRVTGADITVAVMSGNFLQRGEAALLDKWQRAEIAVLNGVDLVLELPCIFANQSAEIFAMGAVDLLTKVNVESVVFGSESGKIEELEKVINLQNREDGLFDIKVKEYIKSGISYPSAVGKAIEDLGENIELSPNNILGLEYLKAIRRHKSEIKPFTIKRENNGYHTPFITGTVSSASSIRNMIMKDELEKVKESVSDITYEVLKKNYEKEKVGNIRKAYNILRYKIITGKNSLGNIQDIENGFENRLYEAACKYEEYEDFYDFVLTKRYTNARLQRIISHILLNIDKDYTSEKKNRLNSYIRVLAFNQKGRGYLSGIKKDTEVPIITNIKNYDEKYEEDIVKDLAFEEESDMVYSIMTGFERRNNPVFVK